jgi:hypothetical protein
MNPFIKQTELPIPITLADWKPLCNAELEVRIKLDFELPLTDDILALMHPSVQAASKTLAELENGIPECKISLEFNELIEIYSKANGGDPLLSLPASPLRSLIVFRATNATADAKLRFLSFTTTVTLPDEKTTEKLVLWALRHIRRPVLIKALETQMSLPKAEAAQE